ncbi:MAG: hypothetical protein WCE90_06740 [Candidatus Zixiibacteriota bacterium]
MIQVDRHGDDLTPNPPLQMNGGVEQERERLGTSADFPSEVDYMGLRILTESH